MRTLTTSTLHIKKKKKNQALAQPFLKNISKKNFKNAKFWFFDFRQKNHLEVVLPTSKYKKWIFWMILSIFGPGNFFHGTNILGSRGFGKFQFFEIFQNLGNFEKSQKIEIFKSFKSPKYLSHEKNFRGQKC